MKPEDAQKYVVLSLRFKRFFVLFISGFFGFELQALYFVIFSRTVFDNSTDVV